MSRKSASTVPVAAARKAASAVAAKQKNAATSNGTSPRMPAGGGTGAANKAPPPGWAQLYNRVIDMRRAVRAPVDIIGCDKLADPALQGTEASRFQTLVALMLSAQTRDFCTAEAVCALQACPGGLTVDTLNRMTEAEINEKIRMVGMHNNKAKYLKAAAARVTEVHQGVVPGELEALLQLPGVGPKMAHLFLQCADEKNTTGIGVDVHVHRIAQRFRWVPPSVKTPEDTRKALESWLPKKHWAEINELLVGFGQTVCTPLRPKCHLCAANDLCPNAFKEETSSVAAASTPLRRRKSGPDDGVDPESSATPGELLALCGGSSQELLARGLLERALPPVQVPMVLQRRLSEVDELKRHASSASTESTKAATGGEPRRKAARAESSDVAAAFAAAASAPPPRWQLADIEDLPLPQDVSGDAAPTADSTPRKAASSPRATSNNKTKKASVDEDATAGSSSSGGRRAPLKSNYFAKK